jgi:hypothetical protein
MLDKIRIIPFFKDQHPETSIKHLFHKDITWFYNLFATKSIKTLTEEHTTPPHPKIDHYFLKIIFGTIAITPNIV